MKRNFRNLFSISGLMGLALLFTCCTQENLKPDDGEDHGNDNDGGQQVEEVDLPRIDVIFAPISGLGEDGNPVGKSRWAADDQVKTFVVSSDLTSVEKWSELEHKYTTDAEKCEENRFVPENEGGLNPKESYDWYVMYPYSDDVKDPLGGEKSKTRFPFGGQIQDNANPTAHLAAYDIMTATAQQVKASETPEFKMEHKCAMMKFNMLNNAKAQSFTLDKIEFLAPEGVGIAGTYSIDFSKRGALTAKTAVSKANLSFKEPFTVEAGERFSAYIMMPPFELKKGDSFTFRFMQGENVMEKTVTLGKNIEVLAGSFNEFDVNMRTDNPRHLQLSKTELFMKKGEIARLEAKVLPEDGTEVKVLWSTDHPEIAGLQDFIDYADIRAFSAGKATITARIANEEAEATCDVYVTTLDKYKLVLKVGETSQFKLLNVPEDSDAASWQSSNPDVLSVDQKGNVTALKTGYADVTVTLGDKEDGMQMTASVTVCRDDVDMEIIQLGDIQIPMVKVEAGSFTMGATWDQGEDARDIEKPAHSVTLTKDYYVGMFEVTQELWNAVMDTIPCHFNGIVSFPVEHVTWDEVVNQFLPKLNQMTGKQFTLLTEAQWEFAARGGNKTQHYRYSGSNVADDVAWFEDNSMVEIENPDDTNHDSFEGILCPHSVGMKLPNELGIYDMSGNVFEWCLDWYGGYSSEAQTDPQGPVEAKSRVLRGGSFDFGADRCRVAFRDKYYPYYWHFRYGFRLAINNL